MVTTFTYKPSLVRIDATQFRVIVVTDPQTHTHTHKHTNKQTNKPTDRIDYNTLRGIFVHTVKASIEHRDNVSVLFPRPHRLNIMPFWNFQIRRCSVTVLWRVFVL